MRRLEVERQLRCESLWCVGAARFLSTSFLFSTLLPTQGLLEDDIDFEDGGANSQHCCDHRQRPWLVVKFPSSPILPQAWSIVGKAIINDYGVIPHCFCLFKCPAENDRRSTSELIFTPGYSFPGLVPSLVRFVSLVLPSCCLFVIPFLYLYHVIVHRCLFIFFPTASVGEGCNTLTRSKV